MSSAGQDLGGALLVAAMPMASGTAFERHAHERHQLAWTDAGALEVSTDDGTWVLPPTRALWLPAGVAHRTAALGATVLRGVYVDPDASAVTWREPTPVDVSPLLAALLMHLGDELPAGARSRAEALLPDLLTAVSVAAIRLSPPHDPRAAEVAAALLADPADDRPLAAWGRAVGASERTLRRGFTQGTGLTFARWRTAARVRASLTRLAGGESVSAVSAAVGYATPSAFVAAFRRETGTTPAAYFRRGSRGRRQRGLGALYGHGPQKAPRSPERDGRAGRRPARVAATSARPAGGRSGRCRAASRPRGAWKRGPGAWWPCSPGRPSGR